MLNVCVCWLVFKRLVGVVGLCRRREEGFFLEGVVVLGVG